MEVNNIDAIRSNFNAAAMCAGRCQSDLIRVWFGKVRAAALFLRARAYLTAPLLAGILLCISFKKFL